MNIKYSYCLKLIASVLAEFPALEVDYENSNNLIVRYLLKFDEHRSKL